MCLSTCLDATALDSFSASVDAKAPCHLSQVERELLGREILRCFSRAFLAQQGPSEKVGIESVAVNDVLAGGSWRVDLVLPWKGDSHIIMCLSLPPLSLCTGSSLRGIPTLGSQSSLGGLFGLVIG